MPKPRFNKDAFLQANKATQEAGSNFGVIQNGLYNAEIQQATLKTTTNGAYQAAFGWQIDADEAHGGQYVWWNQTLVNTNGAMNEIGLQALNQMYYRLSENQFNPDDLQFNEEGECENDEDVHEKFFGTRATIQVIQDGEWNGNPKYKIKVKKILHNAYQTASGDNNGLDEPTEELPDDQPDQQETATISTEEPDYDDTGTKVEIGMPIIWSDRKTGLQRRGRIMNLIDGPTEDEGGMLLVQPTKISDATFTTYSANENDNKPVMLKQEEMTLVEGVKEKWYPRGQEPKDPPIAQKTPEEPEELLDEEPTPPSLEKGQLISYQWEDKTVQHRVHEVNEDEGWVKVVVPKGDKKFARKVPISDVIPF